MPNPLGHVLPGAWTFGKLAEGARAQGVEVLNVELPKRASGLDLAFIDVSSTTHHGVVCGEHGIEEALIDVVEPSSLLANPALGDESTKKRRDFALLLGDTVIGRALRPVDQNAVAGLYLVEQFPEEQRNSDHVDEAEDRVIVRSSDLESLARPESQCRVIAGVEDFRNLHGPTKAVKHFE